MLVWVPITNPSIAGLNDGDRLCETIDAIGQALLTALNVLERADLLKPDSKVKNLPVVLSMFLYFAGDLDDTGAMERDMSGAAKEQIWPNAVVAYANEHDIDLKGKGVYGIADTVDKFDDMELKAFKKKAGPDRWGWKKAVRCPSSATLSPLIFAITVQIFRSSLGRTEWSEEGEARRRLV